MRLTRSYDEYVNQKAIERSWLFVQILLVISLLTTPLLIGVLLFGYVVIPAYYVVHIYILIAGSLLVKDIVLNKKKKVSNAPTKEFSIKRVLRITLYILAPVISIFEWFWFSEFANNYLRILGLI